MIGVVVELLPYGEAALLAEVPDLASAMALGTALADDAAHLARTGPPWSWVLDIVPGARTVLLTTTPGADLVALGRAIRERAASLEPDGAAAEPSAAEVVVPVRYDGPDLDVVARLTGLSRPEVVRAHTDTPWQVAFGGFAPGFAYLAGGDSRLRVPRRDAPRPSVPDGAVGLAGEFSGVYPRASPGGWQLLGRTDVVLWDADRDPPALLRPGTTVRFTDVGALP
ncbi:MAG: 5-oxoprolinase subunit B family protein [Phycicoccus sp.]